MASVVVFDTFSIGIVVLMMAVVKFDEDIVIGGFIVDASTAIGIGSLWSVGGSLSHEKSKRVGVMDFSIP